MLSSIPPVLLVSWAFSVHCLLAQESLVASSSLQPSNLVSTSIPALPSSVVGTIISGLQNATASSSSIRSSSPTEDVTAIAGLHTSTTRTSSSASAPTSARPRPSNTTPCNGYAEFCQRKFSNISMVVAHNSPFVREHNAASNQMLPVLTQLNDGIRGLQFETQKPNASSEIRLCHTSCDYLDVGTLESYLTTVRGWLDSNPYEVIAIMMGNNNDKTNRNPATDYIAPFEQSGMIKYVWTPPSPTMNITDWPTLGEMILKNKRVVVTIDYGANQQQVPWLLSEFNYQWETPFSPTDPAFPCTQQRPPDQTDAISRNRMYMLNHNLNIPINIGLGQMETILIPAYSLLDEINAVSGNGSLGLNVENCEKMWGRPPNWLLVDYYNLGNFNGSVFQVAATANNVSYERDSCCGAMRTSGASAKVENFRRALLGFVFCLVLTLT